MKAAEVQLQALQVSARAFDEGLIGEAARLANAAFILIGRGMKGHTSIFDAADQTDKRLYRSTIPKGKGLGVPLICAQLKKTGETEWEIGLKHLGRDALDGGRDLPFDEWWAESVINNDQVQLSRKDIIRVLRDKNGGAHFDTHLKDELIAAAIRGEIGAFNFENSETNQLQVVPWGIEYCMRQIATELCYSIGLR